MNTRKCALLIAVWAGMATVATAGTLYVDYSNDVFGSIDTSTGVFTQITTFSLSNVNGSLTYNPTAGNFYLSSAVGGGLFSLTTTGELAVLNKATGVKATYGLAQSSDGTLYTYDFDHDNLGTLSANTYIFSSIGNSGINSNVYVGGRMAFYDGTLYGSITTPTIGYFGTFDLATGLFTTIATDASRTQLVLASDGVNLYGLTGNTLKLLNAADGSVISSVTVTNAPTGDVYADGASFAAVPEPGSLALLGIGAAGLALLRRKSARP